MCFSAHPYNSAALITAPRHTIQDHRVTPPGPVVASRCGQCCQDKDIYQRNAASQWIFGFGHDALSRVSHGLTPSWPAATNSSLWLWVPASQGRQRICGSNGSISRPISAAP